MKIFVNTKEISNALSTVIKALPNKVIEPVFSHVLLQAKGGGLQLTASDGQCSITANIEASIEQEGAITLPGKELINLVKTFDTPTLEFTADDYKSCKIKTGKSQYKLNALPSSDFPETSTVTGVVFTVKQAELKGIIEETIFAVAPAEEVRAALKGFLFEKAEKTFTVATADGRKLAVRKTEVDEVGDFVRIFPRKLISDIFPILKAAETPVIFTIGETLVSVTIENIKFVSSFLSGAFPNYKQAIPSRRGQDIVINRLSLLYAIKRAVLMAKDAESPNLLRFSIGASDGIVITANTQDVGEAYEEVQALGCGEPIQICFNGKYLLDCISALSVTDIVMGVSSPTDAVTIKKSVDDEGFLSVIMPVRLK